MRPARLIAGDGPFLGLPAKITIIVFWGMVVLGAAGGYFILDSVERQVRTFYLHETRHFSGRLADLLEQDPVLAEARSAAVLKTLFAAEIRKTVSVRGVEVVLPEGKITVGAVGGVASPVKELSVHDRDRRRHYHVAVAVYQTDIAEILAARRKQVLAAVGASLLVFGALVQLLLRALLTRPFEKMVSTVKAFQAGEESRRFDEKRADEFGYVAHFFNRALDSMAERRRQEVQNALSRADASESALRVERGLAAVTLHAIGDAVLRLDRDSCITYANPAAESLMSMATERLIGARLADCLRLFNENTGELLPDPIKRCLMGESVQGGDRVVLHRESGDAVDISFLATPIKGDAGEILGAVLVMHDTGHVRRLTRELTHQATHDVLTGLCNRRGFEMAARRILDSEIRDRDEHALCLIDMDQFKLVNDICGHAAGDNLLCEMADILRSCVCEGDIVGRLGGDEFALLLAGCNEGSARRMADAILARTRHHVFECGGHQFKLGASMGIVPIPPHEQSLSEMMRAADIACYLAKENGRGQAHVYRESDDATRQHQTNMHWVVRINRALIEDHFRLYCQPVVPVSPKPGLTGYHEVLIRLAGQDNEMILPNAFLPAAERYGLMSAIDRWVVEKTLATLARAGANDDGVFAINLSGVSLSEDAFLPFLLGQIDASGVDPRRLMFEITETAAVTHMERAAVLIERLSERGCTFALDDFGSGISSFAYLRELCVNHLKIDGRFVRHMRDDSVDYNIVGAASAVAGSMNLKTVAEWVESREIFESLRALDVDFAQGFGVGLPVPIETLFDESTPVATRYSTRP